MADEVATIKIKSPDTEQGYIIINADQIAAGMERWYEPGMEPAVEEQAVEPSEEVIEPARRGRPPREL